MSGAEHLVWIDLEMTGLDPQTCTIVEIATIVTDGALETIAEGPNLIIHASDEALEAMHPDVVKLHTRSGLLDKIPTSKVSLAQAEAETLAFVREHCSAHSAPLCGNSIWKDRQFLELYMRELSGYLHYRNVDVSTIKELGRRWYGRDKLNVPAKAETHRALDDIRESIAELRWYRDNLFVPER